MVTIDIIDFTEVRAEITTLAIIDMQKEDSTKTKMGDIVIQVSMTIESLQMLATVRVPYTVSHYTMNSTVMWLDNNSKI